MRAVFVLFWFTFALRLTLLGIPFPLARDGEPAVTIIVEEGAPPVVLEAASELQGYTKKVCGVTLQVKEHGNDHDAAVKIEVVSDLEVSNPETSFVTLQGNQVRIRGATPTAAAFGVYAFLEDKLGIRWFAPGEEWEHVPESATPGTLVVEVENCEYTPTTSPRVWEGYDWSPKWREWKMRNRVVVGEKVPWKGTPFNGLTRPFPPSIYGKLYPEFYPMIGRERLIPWGHQHNWWPCTGNAEVRKMLIDSIREWFEQNPNEDCFSTWLDGSYFICGCELCIALDATAEDYANLRYSSRYYKFINFVAGEVAKTHPGKSIGMLIYDRVFELPADVPKLEPNTFGYLVDSRVSQWVFPGKKESWIANSRNWAARVPNLLRYDHFGLATFSPEFFPHSPG